MLLLFLSLHLFSLDTCAGSTSYSIGLISSITVRNMRMMQKKRNSLSRYGDVLVQTCILSLYLFLNTPTIKERVKFSRKSYWIFLWFLFYSSAVSLFNILSVLFHHGRSMYSIYDIKSCTYWLEWKLFSYDIKCYSYELIVLLVISDTPTPKSCSVTPCFAVSPLL